MIYLVSNYFSSYTHTFPLALNASKGRLWPWHCNIKKGKSIQVYTFAFSWTGSEFDCLWILLFEGWILPEEGSQSLWGLQCSDRIPTGRASRARGGQQIPLAHRQAFWELQYEKQTPWWGFLSVVQSATCMSCPRWELQNPCPFLGSVLLLFKVCWWTVQPSIFSMLFKVLSNLCLTVFSIFPFFYLFFIFFNAMSPPALHLIASLQKQTVLTCRVWLTHGCTPQVKLHSQMWNQWDPCEYIWMQSAAQFGICRLSRSLVFFLNSRVCSASRLLQCFPQWLKCMYKTLQPSRSPRFAQVCTFQWCCNHPITFWWHANVITGHARPFIADQNCLKCRDQLLKA